MNKINILGSYDYLTAPKVNVFNHDGDAKEITITAMHEGLHQALNRHSIIGHLIYNLKKWSQEGEELEKQVFDEAALLLINSTRIIYEGLSVYAEYAVNGIDKDTFTSNLVNPLYISAFNTAIKIENIIREDECSDSILSTLPSVRVFALIDISRFALDIPLWSRIQDKPLSEWPMAINSIIDEDNPLARWRYILEKLSTDENIRQSFIEKSNRTFELWSTKLTKKDVDDDGNYIGALLKDNIESIIAELFHELPYKPPTDEFPTIEKNAESIIDFLHREISENLVFEPALPFSFLQFNQDEQLIDLINQLNISNEVRYYIKVLFGDNLHKTNLSWAGFANNINLKENESLILIHLMKPVVSNDCLEHISSPHFYAFVGKTDEILTSLETVKQDEIILSFGVNMGVAESFKFINDLNIKDMPLFIHPYPHGAFESFWKTVNFLNQEFGRPNVYFAYDGASNEKLSPLVTCFIVAPCNKNIACVTFLTHFAASRIIGLTNNVKDLPFVLHTDAQFDFCTSLKGQSDLRGVEGSLWDVSETNKSRFLAPRYAYLVPSHMLALGV